MSLFCLTGTLGEQKTFTGVSSCDTEWLWKTENWLLVSNSVQKEFVNLIGASKIAWAKNWHRSFCHEFETLWKVWGLNWIVVSNFAPKKYAFLTASRSEVQNSKFGQKLNSGFQFQEGLIENLNLALHCFALHHCIVFRSINLIDTTFNASHPMPSEALPCPPLHCTPYWCSLYPHIILPYLFVLTLYSTSYLLHPWNIATTEKDIGRLSGEF